MQHRFHFSDRFAYLKMVIPFNQKGSWFTTTLRFLRNNKINQQFAPGEEAEEADLWLIFLRFALQPCRVFASAANARKVQQMQKGCVAW